MFFFNAIKQKWHFNEFLTDDDRSERPRPKSRVQPRPPEVWHHGHGSTDWSRKERVYGLSLGVNEVKSWISSFNQDKIRI